MMKIPVQVSLKIVTIAVWLCFFSLLCATPFFTHVATAGAATTTATTSEILKDTQTADASGTVHDAAVVEQKVRHLFKDTPVMIEIARCESKFRQYTDSGNVFRGGYQNAMVGVFQFNGPVHKNGAKALGFDIDTLDGNLDYAKHVYTLSGTDPWVSSFTCWSTGVKASSGGFSNLVFGQTHANVRDLQKRLNAAGFVIADSGPGSPDNETTMFGNLTRVALRQFQCATKLACSGDEYSTGYGLYNSETHDALLEYKEPKTTSKKSATFSITTSKSEPLSADRRAALLAQIAELMKQVAALQTKLQLLRST